MNSIGRKAGCVIASLAIAWSVSAQGTDQQLYSSNDSRVHIKGIWNEQPVLAVTERAHVVIDYEKATFELVFDPAMMATGVTPLDSILRSHAGETVMIQARLLGMKYIDTRSHGPLKFNVEGRLRHGPHTEPYVGKGRLEHIFAGRYACLLDVNFTVPVARMDLAATFPGLTGDLHLHIVQTLLRRATD